MKNFGEFQLIVHLEWLSIWCAYTFSKKKTLRGWGWFWVVHWLKKPPGKNMNSWNFNKKKHPSWIPRKSWKFETNLHDFQWVSAVHFRAPSVRGWGTWRDPKGNKEDLEGGKHHVTIHVGNIKCCHKHTGLTIALPFFQWLMIHFYIVWHVSC